MLRILSFFSKPVNKKNTCICSKEERNKQHSHAFKNLKTRISEARATTWLLYHKCNANRWINTTVCWLLMDNNMSTFTSTSAPSPWWSPSGQKERLSKLLKTPLDSRFDNWSFVKSIRHGWHYTSQRCSTRLYFGGESFLGKPQGSRLWG